LADVCKDLASGELEDVNCAANLALVRREVIVTNADKVHAINQLVGDHEMPTCWGFGKRRVKGAALRCNRTLVSARALVWSCLSNRASFFAE